MSSEIKFSPSSPDLRKQSGDKSDKFKNLRQVAESFTENGSFLTSFRCKTVTTQILRSNISRGSQYMAIQVLSARQGDATKTLYPVYGYRYF